MAKTITLIQIFLSSPDDVDEERALIASLIEEHNRLYSSSTGIMFRVINWKTDTAPEFGTDAQAVINSQIGDEYDVFMGILWARIGSPTPRAESGTIEEFNRAYSRFQRNGDLPRIMIYFKNQPISPYDIDPEQLKKVKDFRKYVEGCGGLHHSFDDYEGLESSMRSHIALLVQKFNKDESSQRKNPKTHAAELALIVNHDDENDLGFLEYQEIFVARMSDIMAALSMITDATERVGLQIEKRAEDLSDSEGEKANESAAKKAIKLAAEDLRIYANSLETQTPILSKSQELAFSALSNALVLYEDFSNPESDPSLQDLSDKMAAIDGVIENSVRQVTSLRDVVIGIPRMTSDLNRAKRAVILQLQKIIEEMEKISSTIVNIKFSIDRMLSGSL